MDIIRAPREETEPAMIDEAMALLQSSGALAYTASWLRTTAAKLQASPECHVVPGLITKFLDPVKHAI
jgi:hypothetical protein